MRARGSRHGMWKGGRSIHSAGYIKILQPNHLRADCNGYVYEHILLAEKILGKPLPPRAEIHHLNGSPGDNKPKNIIICQDRAYHLLLHKRERALKACGHAHWERCWICKQWDEPENMYRKTDGRPNGHPACNAKYVQDNRLRINSVRRDKYANNIEYREKEKAYHRKKMRERRQRQQQT